MAIGATLRQAREEKGLSIDRLSRTTRVQPRLLDALERDDYARLPPRPYTRGMVSAYAREVGLDPDQTVREYFENIDAREAQAAAVAPPPQAPAEASGPHFSAPLILILALIGIGLAVAYNVPTGTASDPLQAVGTSGTTRPLAAASSGDVPAAAPAPAQAGQASRTEVAIVIEANAPSWVAATADGSRVVYRTLQPGERETLRAARELTLRVGNAGAITWTINGQARGSMGKPGEVRDVTLSPDTVSTVR
jgi:cytoskeletal protein RodZ